MTSKSIFEQNPFLDFTALRTNFPRQCYSVNGSGAKGNAKFLFLLDFLWPGISIFATAFQGQIEFGCVLRGEPLFLVLSRDRDLSC